MTKLLPFIQHQCSAPIWRMEIDEPGHIIFLEIRNSQDKKVSFTAVDLTNGNINFEDIATPERWLTGIEAAYDGMLLVHNYQSESGPAHKGLIAIDGISGQTLWSNYTLGFDHLSVNGPVVYNVQIQPRKLVLAAIKTGLTLRAYQPVIDTEADNNIVAAQLLPVEFLEHLPLPVVPYANTVHYIEYNNFRIVSLHTFLDEQLEQHLYILNHEGAVVYHDLLQCNIQKLQPEAFVVHKNKLIYLKNRSELIVLNL
ncbi:DUF4905 domain-containing protein [Mucilaginibacter sp. FT3.2]|uniref:DUF4905 domain-containing protein n=1 Tax=Mucilaginibacter sp. FT3.2 TaxID=2723090 RepID=UPI0016126E32|nr:DUF4905 domain-containing protein [Mucilaginibacter sp. FT3.2]MBB6229881.1 hypothetical protein [Mucilaginibacter sp. FT3.2]